MGDIDNLLEQYETYTSIFAKQIYNRDIWQEQTGCEMDEYFSYVECCEGRLYNFKVWYEHTTGNSYPSGSRWEELRNYKIPLLKFHQ